MQDAGKDQPSPGAAEHSIAKKTLMMRKDTTQLELAKAGGVTEVHQFLCLFWEITFQQGI